MATPQAVTILLRQIASGDKDALDRLIPLVYAELRHIAEAQLRNERAGHTLQPTALVHEAYARMAGSDGLSLNGRAHFLGVAAHSMRKILIDYARIRNAAKRDHGREKIPLAELGELALQRPSLMIALDDALNDLERQDALMARLIELRYFGGLTAEESSAVLGLEVAQVRREIALAQAWLRRQLAASASEPA